MSFNKTTIQLLKSLPQGCYPSLIPGVGNSYSYRPHLAAGIVFCVLFGLSLIGHIIQLARFRRWASLMFSLGALTELLGWAGRAWSAQCPYNHDAFLMQITTLIIAPTFFTAALYMLLGILIRQWGPESSYLSPKIYAIVFCTCDVISLIVQAVGGSLASSESGKIGGNTKPGTNAMVGGIAFQLGTMTFFAILFAQFLIRGVRKFAASRNEKMVLGAMIVSFIMIYIRSIYRTIELAQGWTGYLITHEGYFIGFDAAIMVIAVGVFNIFDPAVLLPLGLPAASSTNDKNINENVQN